MIVFSGHNGSKSSKIEILDQNNPKSTFPTKMGKLVQYRRFVQNYPNRLSRPKWVKIIRNQQFRPKSPKIDFFDQDRSKSIFSTKIG